MVSFPGKPSRLGELLGFPEFLIALRRSFSASIFCHGGAGGRNSISCSYGGLFLVRRPGNISASNLHAHVVAVWAQYRADKETDFEILNFGSLFKLKSWRFKILSIPAQQYLDYATPNHKTFTFPILQF